MMLFFWQYDSLTYVVILVQFTPGSSSGEEGGEGVTHDWIRWKYVLWSLHSVFDLEEKKNLETTVKITCKT